MYDMNAGRSRCLRPSDESSPGDFDHTNARIFLRRSDDLAFGTWRVSFTPIAKHRELPAQKDASFPRPERTRERKRNAPVVLLSSAIGESLEARAPSSPLLADESPALFSLHQGYFAELWRERGVARARRRKDGRVTQIHDDAVAGAPLSPQFYCAYRSIQATRISPGAHGLKSSAAAPSPPPTPGYHFPTFSPTTPPPSPLGRCFFFTLLLAPPFATGFLSSVPRTPSNSISGRVYRDNFLPASSVLSGPANPESNFRRPDDLTRAGARSRLRRDDTRAESRGRSRRSSGSRRTFLDERSSRPIALLRTGSDFRVGGTGELLAR